MMTQKNQDTESIYNAEHLQWQSPVLSSVLHNLHFGAVWYSKDTTDIYLFHCSTATEFTYRSMWHNTKDLFVLQACEGFFSDFF